MSRVFSKEFKEQAVLLTGGINLCSFEEDP